MNVGSRDFIRDLNARIKSIEGLYVPLIMVCGAGKPADNDALVNNAQYELDPYVIRQQLIQVLNENGFIAIMFESNFDLTVPSIEELEVCRYPEIDKVIVFSHSPGAISEFTSFLEDPVIRGKLVILVPEEYHPFTNPFPGYLDSVFWRVLVEGGQVIPYDSTGSKHIWDSIGAYLKTYRAIKGRQVRG